jgi:hypothetical protein
MVSRWSIEPPPSLLEDDPPIAQNVDGRLDAEDAQALEGKAPTIAKIAQALGVHPLSELWDVLKECVRHPHIASATGTKPLGAAGRPAGEVRETHRLVVSLRKLDASGGHL